MILILYRSQPSGSNKYTPNEKLIFLSVNSKRDRDLHKITPCCIEQDLYQATDIFKESRVRSVHFLRRLHTVRHPPKAKSFTLRPLECL